jgi:hypothetical protein
MNDLVHVLWPLFPLPLQARTPPVRQEERKAANAKVSLDKFLSDDDIPFEAHQFGFMWLYAPLIQDCVMGTTSEEHTTLKRSLLLFGLTDESVLNDECLAAIKKDNKISTAIKKARYNMIGSAVLDEVIRRIIKLEVALDLVPYYTGPVHLIARKRTAPGEECRCEICEEMKVTTTEQLATWYDAYEPPAIPPIRSRPRPIPPLNAEAPGKSWLYGPLLKRAVDKIDDDDANLQVIKQGMRIMGISVNVLLKNIKIHISGQLATKITQAIETNDRITEEIQKEVFDRFEFDKTQGIDKYFATAHLTARKARMKSGNKCVCYVCTHNDQREWDLISKEYEQPLK